jgi:hypothetical protein
MAWPNPFRIRDENTRTFWGYTFQLTSDHLTLEQSHPLKFSYDRLGEDAWNRLNEISPPERSAMPRNLERNGSNEYANEREKSQADTAKPTQDLYLVLKVHAEKDEVLGRLWREINAVPEWVDWEQIARGQDVFYRYAGPSLTGLAFQSLLGGMVRCRNTSSQVWTSDFPGRQSSGGDLGQDWGLLHKSGPSSSI